MSIRARIKGGVSRARLVHVRSVLTPFLWSFAWSLGFLGFAVIFRDDGVIKYFLLSLAAVPMVMTMALGCYFAVTDPDRLQSDDYRVRRRRLQRSTSPAAQVHEVPQLKIVENPQDEAKEPRQ